jgi:hypothetical protein
MKKSAFLIAMSVAFVFMMSVAAFAQTPNFNASRTFEFDPDRTGDSVAYWKNGIGLSDSTGKTSFGLELEKNGPTSDVASAGAVLNGLKGVVVQGGDTLGFDITNASPCSGGAPRFNVSYITPLGASAFSFVGGCGNATQAPAPQSPLLWKRVTIDLQNPAQAFPVIPPGSILQSVVLIVDEQGKYLLDNIQFRGQYADKPGNSGPSPAIP